MQLGVDLTLAANPSKDGGDITIGSCATRGESPPRPKKLRRLELIGTVRSDRLTKTLGPKGFLAAGPYSAYGLDA